MERNTNPISPFDASRSDTAVECGRRLKMMIGPRHLFNFHLPRMRDCDGMRLTELRVIIIIIRHLTGGALAHCKHWLSLADVIMYVAGVQAERDFYGITFRSLSNRHSSTTSSRSKGLRGNLFGMTELVVSIANFQKLSID